MLKRPHLIGLGATVLVVVILLNLPAHATARLKLAIGSLFAPLFGLANAAETLGDAGGVRLLPKSVLAAEVERLRRENEQLQLQAMQAEETARENAVLREAIGWQKRFPWQTRLARVIGRDPANWWRSMTINLGSNDGLTKDMPVITPQGLVGKVYEVGARTSRVVLVGDPLCPVPAVIDNPGGETGSIVAGESTVLDESIVQLTYLSRHSQAVPGQKVFTSGLGGVFPKAIPIGQIIETNSVEYGLYIEARVKLSANIRQLEEVFVILQ